MLGSSNKAAEGSFEKTEYHTNKESSEGGREKGVEGQYH